MMSVSVLAYVKANQMRPSVSRARIREIRGATCLNENDAGASVGAQILRKNFVWLSQDSSTLMILLPFEGDVNAD